MEQNNGEGTGTPPVAEEKDPQDPSKENKRSEKEKAEFSLKKTAERLVELGGDPSEALNLKNLPNEISDDTPLTLGKLKEIQKSEAHKTALEMAETLPDNEKEEVKTLLRDNIKPSGNAENDLKIARAAVNATHNAQIAELLSRGISPKKTAAGGSGDSPRSEEFVPTPEEKALMGPPYNLSKEKVIAARPK